MKIGVDRVRILNINQLKYGALLSYIAIGLNIIVGLAYTPFMLRTMGQSEYGLYSLAAAVISYLTILDLGFGNAIVRYTAKFRAENKEKEQHELFGMFLRLYSIIGLIALAIGIVLWLNIGALFDNSMTDSEISILRVLLLLMSFNIAFTFPLSIFGSIISAYENFVFQKIVNIVRIILNPLVMVLFLLFGYKAITMVVVTTIFNLLSLSINCWYCLHKLQIKFIFGKFNWSFLKEVSIYSLWIFLNIIMDRIYWSTGQFILGMYRGADSVAIYAIAIQLKTMFFMFATAISGVFLPKITKMVTVGASDKDVSDFFIKTGRIQFVVMSYILSAFILFGKEFITLWAGPDYQDAFLITILLFTPAIIPLIQNLGIIILQARNQMRFRSLLYILIAIVSIFIAIPFAKLWGGIGCAIATSLALFVGQVIIMNIYYARKQKINIIRFWREILSMAIVPMGLTFIFGVFVKQYYSMYNFSYLVFGAFVFTIIYIPLFWVFSLNRYERELFGGTIKKILIRR